MTSTVSTPYFLNSSAISALITSPLTAMGIAGGHATVGAAQMRPSQALAGTVSCGAKNASRMLIARTAFDTSSGMRIAGSLPGFPAAQNTFFFVLYERLLKRFRIVSEQIPREQRHLPKALVFTGL